MRLGAHALSFDWAPFWIVLAGMAAMYGPSFHDLFNGIWSTDENAHGPIVLAVALWLLYTKWNDIADRIEPAPAPILGWPLVVASLLFYILGRSQDILIFEIGSLIPMLAGLILVFFGRATLLRLWFPLFFMLFMIPLPGILVDAVTQPMKMGVSWAAEHLLYALGYPIARTGVILVIGQYQLLVADACAGLHSLFTLEALGLLYLNLVRHDSFARNVTLAILIVPISFCANVIRVIVLTLITYHFGDEAGQGFLHGFAGMVLFISALILIIGVDSMLRFGVRKADAAA
ncbi:exosortase B [Methyloversatilis discipulorum]|uniref:exosortase B n=1 Tax=Methyloversatilis discipulorum TaxID=1119528 RepID=UPI0003788EB2|nr:exosortase B [Methyloversatilis discipulorum]